MDTIEESQLYGFSIKATGLGSFNSVDATTILQESQRHTIQVLATVTSSISLAAAICAMFWFFMMRRNFRRDLVLLLIASGFWKSLWFVVFPAFTYVHGPVQTDTAFCQASGYSLQVGFEACDISVLFMSMHMYYQIFPPKDSMLGHDGLYRVRHWVLAAWVIFPNLSASLAFTNPRAAYMAQGAFCSIPLRPIWYRLALFWIPRYLVWIYVVYVAVRIYRHVGLEFKVFGQEKDGDSSRPPGESLSSGVDKIDDEGRQSRPLSTLMSSNTDSKGKSDNSLDGQSAPYDAGGLKLVLPKVSPPDFVALVPFNAARRESTPDWSSTFNSFGVEASRATSVSKSNPGSRRGSQQVAPEAVFEDLAQQSTSDADKRRSSAASNATKHSSIAPSEIVPLPPIRERPSVSSSSSGPPSKGLENTPNKAMRKRQQAINRQLRLLFIYPCVYMILWTIPFVVNIMNYTDYYAQHPIFALQIVQVFMLTMMTTADVVIFCWRERPWRHIPGSDGTFIGSFMWWRYCFDTTWATGRRASRAPSIMPDLSNGSQQTPYRDGVWGSLRSLSIYRKLSASSRSQANTSFSSQGQRIPPHKRAFSGISDRKQAETQRAHQRLAMERLENEQKRQESLQEKRASAVSATAQPATERREWFDHHLESDLFTDHDHEHEESDDIV